jgi:LysR family transcriptional regulator, cys regulon transcriptional activator
MNLHQFRFVQEAVRRNLNLTETAKALFTSQPGISKAILELEEELGVDIFARHGKRLKRVTEPGQQVLKSVEIIMREVANLKRIGDEFSKQDAGTLSIATTHTQARYFLPEPVAQLRRRYPKVQVVLHQGMPQQVVRMLLDDVAEIGLATEALAAHDDLITLPCHEWQHVLVVPAGHALAAVERPTLEQLAAFPLVLYQPTVTGRTRIDNAFERARLKPLVALEAIDSDVIKTYVRLGLGVGIVTELAMRTEPALNSHDTDLAWRPLGHLFGNNVTRVAFKRGAYLRQFVLAFAELLSPRLTPALLARAMSGEPTTDYEL